MYLSPALLVMFSLTAVVLPSQIEGHVIRVPLLVQEKTHNDLSRRFLNNLNNIYRNYHGFGRQLPIHVTTDQKLGPNIDYKELMKSKVRTFVFYQKNLEQNESFFRRTQLDSKDILVILKDILNFEPINTTIFEG